MPLWEILLSPGIWERRVKPGAAQVSHLEEALLEMPLGVPAAPPDAELEAKSN